MADKVNTVRARVTQLTYINDVLHYPGEIAVADLDALGITKLGEQQMTDVDGRKEIFDLTPGLEPLMGDDEPEPIGDAAAGTAD